MAKRKNSAALFEVINSGKSYSQGGGGWSMPKLPSFSFLRRHNNNGNGDAVAPAASEASSSRAQPSKLWNMITSIPRVRMALDPDRQVVSFKLSYTTALVTAFAVFAIVALAFVVGRSLTRHNGPALADQTTDELRAGPVQSDVLDVGPDSAMAMATSPLKTGTPAPATPSTPANKPAPQTARPTWNEPKGPTTFVDLNQKRTVNLHYVLMQSYPTAEKQMAEEACQSLNKNGILCTIEFGTYYAPTCYAVVGVAGFDRIKNSPEFDQYIDRIIQVGDRLGEKSKFKKLDPKPFKWRETKP